MFTRSMSEHDIEAVMAAHDELRSKHTVDGLAARFRAAQATYFGDDVTGYISGRTLNNVAAMIAIVRGEGAEKAYAYSGKMEMDALVAELRNALDEAGFDEFELAGNSVGPDLPLILAMLSETHGVGVSSALGAHSDLIDYDYD